jgi:hypothetical protein
MRRISLSVLALALLVCGLSAQMGHAPDAPSDSGREGGAISGTGDLHFVYDKLIDSTTILGASLSDAHGGSNFLMTAVTGHNVRPMIVVIPSYRVEGKKHQPPAAPDSIELLVSAVLESADPHAAARMDAKAPNDGQLILLLDDSVRTRVPLKLLDTDSYVSYFGAGPQGTGTTSYVAIVPYAFVVRWSAASKVEGRMPSGDFNLHGKDAHKWQPFVDYVSGKSLAAAP